MSERYEYKTETYSPGGAKLLSGGVSKHQPFAEWLNDRGSSGWLLVSMVDRPEIMRMDQLCVFARRIEEEK